MSYVDTAFSIGLILALAFSIGNARAWAWLGAGAASYIVSTIYWRLGLPHAPFIGGLADAAICLAVYLWGRYRWEMIVWRLFQASVAVNVVYASILFVLIKVLHYPPDFPHASLLHNAYSGMLEVINAIALLWIGGNGAMQIIGATNAHRDRPWRRVLGPVSALYRERKDVPFYKVG